MHFGDLPSREEKGGRKTEQFDPENKRRMMPPDPTRSKEMVLNDDFITTAVLLQQLLLCRGWQKRLKLRRFQAKI
jgi:hypothetical protein